MTMIMMIMIVIIMMIPESDIVYCDPTVFPRTLPTIEIMIVMNTTNNNDDGNTKNSL